MDAKIFFINEFRSGPWTMTDLCREVGISRTVDYKYLHRLEQFGIDGYLNLEKPQAT